MINKKRRGMKVERNEHRIDVGTNTERRFRRERETERKKEEHGKSTPIKLLKIDPQKCRKSVTQGKRTIKET